jgi:hypothetical protein
MTRAESNADLPSHQVEGVCLMIRLLPTGCVARNKLCEADKNSTTVWHRYTQLSPTVNFYRLNPCAIFEKHWLAVIQLIVETVAVKCRARNRVAAIGHEPLQFRRLASASLRYLEGKLCNTTLNRGVGVVVFDRSVVVMEIDQHDFGQLTVYVASVGGFELIVQINIHDLWTIGGMAQVPEEGCDCDVAVVRSFCTNGCAVCADRLPGLISVVRTLVHMEARDILRCHEEICVDTLSSIVSPECNITSMALVTSFTHNAAPKVLDRPGAPCPDRELPSPRMNGRSAGYEACSCRRVDTLTKKFTDSTVLV